MNRRLARLLLHCYPSKWRTEYGPELEQLLRRAPSRLLDVLDVMWGGLTERIRQPFARFTFYSLLGSAIVFATSLVLAPFLWRIFASPVADLLRQQDVRPSTLVQVTPFEGFAVVRMGVPLLTTAFFTFAWMLVLARILLFARLKEIRKRKWAIRLILSSGCAFVLSSLTSFIAWQRGSVAKLLEWFPDYQNAPSISLEHCFVLLGLSTFGTRLLLQIPIFLFFGWRLRAIRKVKAQI